MVSFDVFDTIITRNVYHPQDIFLKIQGKLSNIYPNELPEELIHNYRNIRLNAESTARTELAGKEEVTLSEILSVIARRFQLDNTSVDKLKELEIEEELASVVLVDSVANLLWRARDNGYGIIFISDMYLPDNVIRDMLIKVRVFSPGDHLYVSGSIGSKKTSGRLFQHVLNDLKVCTDQIVHIGDYLISDYIAPKFKLGIRSLPVRVARKAARPEVRTG